MSIEQIIKHFGGIAQAARALGVSRQSVYNWLRAGEMPELRRMQAEIIIREARQ